MRRTAAVGSGGGSRAAPPVPRSQHFQDSHGAYPDYPDCRGVAAHHATHAGTSAPPPTTLHCDDTAHYHNKLALPVVTKLDRVQLDSNFYAKTFSDDFIFQTILITFWPSPM